jgi:Lon protease-like protein
MFPAGAQAVMTGTPVPIPPEAPVMVLPGAVLFPSAVLPLRIFEPRYRAMLQWALEHDRMFCVALMKPGVTEAATEDQFFHTAGIGLVSASVTQADGTSNLMLQGLARVRFDGFRQLSPFRIADIEPLVPAGSATAKAGALASELREQCAVIRLAGSPLPDSFSGLLRTITDNDVLADTVAQSLVSDAFERQRILEEQDTAVRLRLLLRILREQFQAR